MHRFKLLAATIVALGLIGAGGAEARSPAETHRSVSRQAARTQAHRPGRAVVRQAAPQREARRAEPDGRRCGSGARVSMFYSTGRDRGVHRMRTSWGRSPAPFLEILGGSCMVRGTTTWT